MNRMIKSLTSLKFLLYGLLFTSNLFAPLISKANTESILWNYKNRVKAFVVKHEKTTSIKNLHYFLDPIAQINANKKTIDQIYPLNNLISLFDVASNPLVIKLGSLIEFEYNYFLLDGNNQKPLYFSKNKVEFSCRQPFTYKPKTYSYKIINSSFQENLSEVILKNKQTYPLKKDSLSLWIRNICKKLENSNLTNQNANIGKLIILESSFSQKNKDNEVEEKIRNTKIGGKREKNAFLGIQTTYLKSYYINPYYEKRFGYSISTVYQGSDAFRKGINKNDLILEINGISIDQIVNEYCMNGKLSEMPSEKIIYSKIQHENCQGFLGIRDGKPEIEINNQIQKIIEDDLNNGRKTVLMILKNGDPNGSSSRGCNYRNQYCENIEVELEPTNIDEFMKNYY